MVMEAPPSPQSVGREFVRQYYTLLNEAPTYLHRFYNQQSSFIHGGLDSNRDSTPAIGQKQIHQKILQLNFRDCHAKISQVDSQLTLENGVVVQVSGELSNAGQPMRRFTQTFVLAIQAPKKYYVHNDIFRYQDLIFPDEEESDVGGVESGISKGGDREGEEGGRSETEEDEHQNQGEQLLNAATVTDPQTQTSLIPPQQPSLQQPVYYAPPQPQQHVHPVMQQVLNGSVHDENSLMSQQQQTASPLPPQPQHQYIVEPTAQAPFVQESEIDTVTDEQQPTDEVEARTEEDHKQSEDESFSIPAKESEPEHSISNTGVGNSGPKTYATSVKSLPTTTGSSSPQAPKLSMSPPPVQNLRSDDRSPLLPPGGSTALSATGGVSTVQQQGHRVVGNPSQQPLHQQRAPRSGPVQRDGERRGTRPGQYSDAHQLFLGNLPHNASENDLREVFERYGKVADLRVHSKATERCKGPQGGNNAVKVPNYGFITFEDQQIAAKVLQSGPIYFPDKSGHALNVEAKKSRPRMSMDGSGGKLNAGDGNMRPMGGQQQQQQHRGLGGPGVIRGGQHGARGGRGGFSRGGDIGRGGGGMRQPGPSNPSYQNRR